MAALPLTNNLGELGAEITKEPSKLVERGANTKWDIEEQFRDACFYGRLEEAKKVYAENSWINIHEYDEWVLYFACLMGHLETAQWLVSIGADIHVNNDAPFRECIKRHNLHVAKWLIELGSDYHFDNELAFRKACADDFLDYAQWMWNYGITHDSPINIHAKNDEAFRDACIYGNLDVAKWLWEISEKTINIHVDNDYVFTRSHHRDVLDWLESIRV